MVAAEHYVERLAVVEANVTDLRGHLNTFAVGIEVTRRKSLELIGEMATEIEKKSELAHAKAHALCELGNRTISALAGRVDTLEAKGAAEQYGYPYNQKSLVPAKAMVPSKLAKVEEWKEELESGLGGLCGGEHDPLERSSSTGNGGGRRLPRSMVC